MDRECDPVCQWGCRCGERCVIRNGVACVDSSDATLAVGDTCNPQENRCRPGGMCMREARDVCGAHCYQLCRVDSDCGPNRRCTTPLPAMGGVTVSACSAPAEGCDPIGAAACTSAGHPAPTFACYILTTRYADMTACACAGTKTEGAACQAEHECTPGLECVSLMPGNASCRRVCRLGASGCPAGQTCTAFPGARVYGFCR
jgi:hypothetical protein